MALFSMRDSWNVWRRKVNNALGGLSEPIDAEDVVYDNTDSGLTATDVQSAIDEVEGRVDDVEDDLSSLYTNGYILTSYEKYTYKTSSDTYGTALDAICAAMNNVLGTLDDDEMIIANNLVITGVCTFVGRKNPNYKTDTHFNYIGTVINPYGGSNISIFACVGYGGSGTSYVNKLDTANNLAFQDITSTTLADDKDIVLSYFKFKKIKSST